MLEGKKLTKGTKLRLVDAMVIPTWTYQCKHWAPEEKPKCIKQIQAIQLRVLQWTEGVSRWLDLR